MFAFFSQLSKIISTVINGLVNMFQQVVMVFQVIAQTLDFAFKFMGYIPTPMFALGMFFISYCIIVNVLHKGG